MRGDILTTKANVAAIILAAGSGSRMNSPTPKQRMEILGQSILERSVKTFDLAASVSSIVVVVREDEIEIVRSMLSKRGLNKPYLVISGGSTRQESAAIGYRMASENAEFIAIHDAARCLVTVDMIEAVIDSALKYGAATASSPVSDTIKRVRCDFIEETVPRSELVAAQTPQVFSRALYDRALSSLSSYDEITDDNMLIEKIGEKIICVNTGKENVKITTPEDMLYAEFILNKRNSNE